MRETPPPATSGNLGQKALSIRRALYFLHPSRFLIKLAWKDVSSDGGVYSWVLHAFTDRTCRCKFKHAHLFFSIQRQLNLNKRTPGLGQRPGGGWWHHNTAIPMQSYETDVYFVTHILILGTNTRYWLQPRGSLAKSPPCASTATCSCCK